MINNFEEIKKQLAELSTVINSFKSEAVQLKIVELIFQSTTTVEEAVYSPPKNNRAGKKKSPKQKARQNKSGKKTSKTKKQSPSVILNELIDEGYFNEPKTINDIIQHCNKNRAMKFRPNELSSPLTRFTREKKLTRDKNEDNQYEYTKGQ